jgi:uncharacterized peroxidase-related enzyme
MPRLNVVEPASAEGKTKELFDGPLKGKHFNIFKGIANSPAALNAYLQLSGALADGLLDAKEREIIALAIGELNQCNYCLAAHTAIGKMSGLKDEQMLAARRGEGDAKHAALAKFAQTLAEKHGDVSDDDISAVKAAGYGDGHLAEIVANYALNIYTNYFNHLNQTDVDFPAAPSL